MRNNRHEQHGEECRSHTLVGEVVGDFVNVVGDEVVVGTLLGMSDGDALGWADGLIDGTLLGMSDGDALG